MLNFIDFSEFSTFVSFQAAHIFIDFGQHNLLTFLSCSDLATLASLTGKSSSLQRIYKGAKHGKCDSVLIQTKTVILHIVYFCPYSIRLDAGS